MWGSPYKGRWIGQNERPVGEDGAEGWGVWGGEERMHQNSKKEQPPPTTTTTTVPTTSPSSSSSSSSSGTKARRTDGRTASESASTTRVGGVSPLFSLCFSLAGVWGETPPSLPALSALQLGSSFKMASLGRGCKAFPHHCTPKTGAEAGGSLKTGRKRKNKSVQRGPPLHSVRKTELCIESRNKLGRGARGALYRSGKALCQRMESGRFVMVRGLVPFREGKGGTALLSRALAGGPWRASPPSSSADPPPCWPKG